MDKIEFTLRRHPLKYRMSPSKPDTVPAHMRHLKSLSINISKMIRKPADLPLDQSQARGIIFLAHFHNNLCPQADPEYRPFISKGLPYRLIQSMSLQVNHSLSRSPHPRKDYPFSPNNLCIVTGDNRI